MGPDLRRYNASVRDTPTAPQQYVTQATFPSRDPVTSHNSLHANHPSRIRTGFGVHAPTRLSTRAEPTPPHPDAAACALLESSGEDHAAQAKPFTAALTG